MGYASTLPFATFELGSVHIAGEVTVSTVASDFQFNIISIPNMLLGRVEHAYLDAYFPYVHNSAAGNNHAEAGKIQTARVGGAYTDAITIGTQTMYLDGGATGDMGRFIGNYDIASTVESAVGAWLVTKWGNALSHADSLLFRDAYIVLRVIT